MDRCCGDPLGPECIECGRVVCMACDDATDVYDRDGAPHKCHRACAGKAQDGADKASAEAPDFADEGSGPVVVLWVLQPRMTGVAQWVSQMRGLPWLCKHLFRQS